MLILQVNWAKGIGQKAYSNQFVPADGSLWLPAGDINPKNLRDFCDGCVIDIGTAPADLVADLKRLQLPFFASGPPPPPFQDRAPFRPPGMSTNTEHSLGPRPDNGRDGRDGRWPQERSDRDFKRSERDSVDRDFGRSERDHHQKGSLDRLDPRDVRDFGRTDAPPHSDSGSAGENNTVLT